MSGSSSLLQWILILVVVGVIGYFGYSFLFGSATPADSSGLPNNGGFFQVPVASPLVYSKESPPWKFTLTANNAYTLAGRVVGRHEYPATLPEGIIPLDLAVANGDLLANNNLQYFRFTMGDHTLQYTYDVPTYTGLTEEYIDEHISNSHLVFLDPALESRVKAAREGDCLIIKGKLVDINGNSPQKGYIMKTSTVRNDEYPAGCEIILVESFEKRTC